MTMNKDEILSQIVKLQQEQEKHPELYDSVIAEVNQYAELQRSYQQAFDDIKKALSEAAQKTNEAKYKRDALINENKARNIELDKLRRELSRIEDFEHNYAAYLAEVEEFKNKCLESYWRKENRSDGRGALPHQIDGAIHLAIQKMGLLGDKRGLGKTLTNLIWLDLIEAKKAIAIVPNDTMENYIREIKLWAPHRNVIKLGGMTRAGRDAFMEHLGVLEQYIIVINYEAWRRDEQLIEDIINLRLDTFVEDEAHRAKTLTTATCKGATRIRFGANQCIKCGSGDIAIEYDYRNRDMPDFSSDLHYCRACNHSGIITDFCSIKNVMPMTGTPILNKPQELFPQLRMIDVKNFHTEADFLMDFCRQSSSGRWGWGYKAEERLMKVIGPKYLARDRKAAGVIIPPASIVEHTIDKAWFKENYPQQYKAYEQVRQYAQLVFDPDKEIVMNMVHAITVFLRLRQVLTWAAAIKLKYEDPETGQILFEANLDVEESVKIDKAEELAREFIEEGDRVVLFSQFKAPLHVLQKRLGARAVVYDGATSDYMRNRIQLDFDAKTAPVDPSFDIVLANYKAAAEGLNFNAATKMIILDEEWNPGRQSQAYGRIDRLGQTRETEIHIIRVDSSIDTYMAELIEGKRQTIQGFETEADKVQSAYDALKRGEI